MVCLINSSNLQVIGCMDYICFPTNVGFGVTDHSAREEVDWQLWHVVDILESQLNTRSICSFHSKLDCAYAKGADLIISCSSKQWKVLGLLIVL